MAKPNIVVFFTDQQRADTCGCYGQTLDTTPNLDKFAEEGTLFENAYTCQPVCGPARAAIQSGVYPTKTGCFINGIALPKNTPTLAKYLSKYGYKTGYVGKWHLASDDGTNDYQTTCIPEELRGGYQDCFTAADVLEFTSHGYGGYVFDRDGNKKEFSGYRADCITDYALDFINGQDSYNPFFLFLSHIEPHHQNDHKRYEGPHGSKEKYADFPIPKDLEHENGDWRENYPDYLGCVNSLDRNFGRVIATLKEKGLYDNTIIFFTSDHGSHFKTRNAEYKRSCHDSSIHIPFVACGGPFSRAQRITEVISLIDLPKTILSCCGIIPIHFDGIDLTEVANGKKTDNCAFIQISESEVARAIRTSRYTYSANAPDKDAFKDSNSVVYRDEYLYDNETDPYQKVNLIHDDRYSVLKKGLRKQLKKEIKKYENIDIKFV